jgi:hypothetical protein
LGDKGARVHNLHSALQFLLLHQSISDNDLRILRQRLAPEMRDETFGKATSDLVGIWQDQMKHRLDVPKVLRDLLPVPANGDVNTPTADALNWLLAKLGARSGAAPLSGFGKTAPNAIPIDALSTSRLENFRSRMAFAPLTAAYGIFR